jgi:hypothetical protein
MAGLLDFLQSASNTAADTVAAPVDVLAWALRKAGVPVGTPVGGTDWMRQQGLRRDVPQSAASLAGETVGLLSPMVAAAKAPQIAKGLLQVEANAAAPRTLRAEAGVLNFDPRFDPRVKEAQRLIDLTPVVTPRQMQPAKPLSMTDLVDMPFITSMADRTAAGGVLTGINDVRLSRPVNLQGGKDFMFDNPGMAWASGRTPTKQLIETADALKKATGKDPLFIPWRMAPTGGDFATMTGETMLSYANETLGKRDVAKLDRAVRQYIPEWKGLKSDDSVQQFREAPDRVRKALKNMMDVEFRDRGGLGIGEARLAVTDPKQYAGSDGQIMNVGRIFADQGPIKDSGHVSYPWAVPGEGVGRLTDQRNIFELLPQVVQGRGIQDATKPAATDIRALQMKPYAGIISESLLRSLGY